MSKLQRLIWSDEYYEFRDFIKLESPFVHITENGLGIKQLHMGVTNKMIIFGVYNHNDICSSVYIDDEEEELENFELLRILPLNAVKLFIHDTNTCTLKLVICDEEIMYLEMQERFNRVFIWQKWCQLIEDIFEITNNINNEDKHCRYKNRYISRYQDKNMNNSLYRSLISTIKIKEIEIEKIKTLENSLINYKDHINIMKSKETCQIEDLKDVEKHEVIEITEVENHREKSSDNFLKDKSICSYTDDEVEINNIIISENSLLKEDQNCAVQNQIYSKSEMNTNLMRFSKQNNFDYPKDVCLRIDEKFCGLKVKREKLKDSIIKFPLKFCLSDSYEMNLLSSDKFLPSLRNTKSLPCVLDGVPEFICSLKGLDIIKITSIVPDISFIEAALLKKIKRIKETEKQEFYLNTNDKSGQKTNSNIYIKEKSSLENPCYKMDGISSDTLSFVSTNDLTYSSVTDSICSITCSQISNNTGNVLESSTDEKQFISPFHEKKTKTKIYKTLSNVFKRSKIRKIISPERTPLLYSNDSQKKKKIISKLKLLFPIIAKESNLKLDRNSDDSSDSSSISEL